MRIALRSAVAAVAIAIACGLARLAGAVLPLELAMAAGLAVSFAIPGWALACVTGLRDRMGTTATLALLPITGLAAWVVPLALGMALELSFGWVLGLVLAASAVAFGAGEVSHFIRWPRRDLAGVCGAGFATAVLCLQWQPQLQGDAIYHAGVLRKLLALPGISLRGITPLTQGHPHAGYAFPLLDAVEAGACKLTAIDATTGYPHLPAAFAFLLPVVWFAGGRALAGRTVGTITAVLAVWDLAARDELGFLNQPPFFAFLIMIPAAAILIAELGRDPEDRDMRIWLVVAAFLVAVIHPTYAVPFLAILAGLVVVARRTWPVLAASVVANLAVFAFIWLVAIHGAPRAKTIPVSGEELMVWRGHVIGLAGRHILRHRPEMMIALVAAPALLLRWRRAVLPAALVAAPAALISFPGMGGVLTDLIGVGQATRLWEAIPWQFVTAAVIVLAAARLRGWRLIAAVIAVGALTVLIQQPDWFWADEVDSVMDCPLPDAISVGSTFSLINLFTTIAAVASVAALVVAFVRRRRLDVDRLTSPANAAALLTAAVLAGSWQYYGHGVWTGIRDGVPQQHLLNQTSPGLVAFLRTHDSSFPNVLAPYNSSPADWFSGIAYQLTGRADVYVVAIAEPHTRAFPRDDPQARRNDVNTFMMPSTPESERDAIMQRYQVDYVVIDLKSTSPATVTALRADPSLHEVYRDPPTPFDQGRFVVFQRTP